MKQHVGTKLAFRQAERQPGGPRETRQLLRERGGQSVQRVLPQQPRHRPQAVVVMAWLFCQVAPLATGIPKRRNVSSTVGFPTRNRSSFSRYEKT